MFVPKPVRQPVLGAPPSPIPPAEPHERPAVDPRFTLGERAPLSVLLTHDAVAVLRGTSVESVVSFMLRTGLSTLPVTDGAGGLLGVVSIHRLLATAVGYREAFGHDPGLQPQEHAALADALDDGCLSSASIGDVMTPSTLALRDQTTISRAVRVLTREGLSEVPVKCEQCQGYCIVSALELLRWLSRSRLGAR